MNQPAIKQNALQQYLFITANYWVFTITDGALRMLVVLHFHQLGYNPIEIALLFLFYEFFGVITNLTGGWLGARFGLNRTMNSGLCLQILALSMLLLPTDLLSVAWVMMAQALSGIAKDLNKMSAKSAIRILLPDNADSRLYRWVAVLTGSKNALKGAGFFVGAGLLGLYGFQTAVALLIAMLVLILAISLFKLGADIGKSKHKPKFSQVFSRSSAINKLSVARLFLFGARDVWFVVALPVFFSSSLGWSHWKTGAFMAGWIIFYGVVQSISPWVTGVRSERPPSGNTALIAAIVLTTVTVGIAIFVYLPLAMPNSLLIGLFVFAGIFALNSAIHSYLVVRYAQLDSVSQDVGFYYMANAAGRFLGTVVSGWAYQVGDLLLCLQISCGFLIIASVASIGLPRDELAYEAT
jgi:MFS family permease